MRFALLTAIVAALQVATESGSPADFDGSHDVRRCPVDIDAPCCSR